MDIMGSIDLMTPFCFLKKFGKGPIFEGVFKGSKMGNFFLEKFPKEYEYVGTRIVPSEPKIFLIATNTKKQISFIDLIFFILGMPSIPRLVVKKTVSPLVIPDFFKAFIISG